jgi:hypothetical protein
MVCLRYRREPLCRGLLHNSCCRARVGERTVSHALYDVWEAEDLNQFQWMAQMHNFVGHFPTEKVARAYVQAVRVHRKEIDMPKKEVKK